MSITKKLLLITTIMAVLITAELAALTVTIKILSAVRAYVGGEGLWSKAQKNAIYYLTKYTYTHDEKDYQQYLDFLKIPLSDHQARIALKKNPIDYDSAKQGFSGGDVHADDIDGIIWLFNRFYRFYYINKAIKVWGQADDLLLELIQQGEKLHQSISTHQTSSIESAIQLENIDHLNNQLTAIENKFSYTLGEGSRWLENIIFKLLLSIAIIVEFTGILLTTLIGIRISRNIKVMNKIASKIGQSDFSERVNISSKDELGQLAMSFNTMIDELDQHDKKRQLLEKKFRSILESAPDAMVLADQEGAIVMINAQTEKMFGYPKSEVIGKHVQLLIPERDNKEHSSDNHSYFTKLHPRLMDPSLELFGQRKDGKEFPLEISLSFIETDEGILASAAIRDISERKCAEERFKKILEAMPDAVIMINKNGNIVFLNKQTEQIFGYKKNELIGQQIEKLIPTRFHTHHPQIRMNYFTNPQNRLMGTDTELFGLRKDGEEFPVEISLNPLHMKDEMVAVATVRDMTERKKMDKLKNEFISVLSHELRTPLTSIKGSLDLLTTGMMSDLSALGSQTLLNLAKKNCERLVRLINDILDVEKIESGHMEFLFKPIILSDLLKEAVMANQPYGEHFQVKIKLLHYQENIIVDADYDRLIQVLSNLISNAIKFSPPAGEVTVSSTLHHNQVQVSVTDHGPGIPVAFQSKIFQKFAQADSTLSREHSGTGLGLNISKTIIERHGGSIFFKTKANQGTTFSFNLPIKAISQ